MVYSNLHDLPTCAFVISCPDWAEWGGKKRLALWRTSLTDRISPLTLVELYQGAVFKALIYLRVHLHICSYIKRISSNQWSPTNRRTTLSLNTTNDTQGEFSPEHRAWLQLLNYKSLSPTSHILLLLLFCLVQQEFSLRINIYFVFFFFFFFWYLE